MLRPFLKPDDRSAFVFTPKEVIAELRTEARQRRKTALTPSQRARDARETKSVKVSDFYKQSAYYRAITRAALRAGVSPWHPHQLRHNCATRIRRKYGLEGASAVLGHRFGTVTEIYAESCIDKAKEIMRDLG